MPTLYVENVPDDLYNALRLRARSEGRSISAEVMKLLAEHVPTQAELARRRRAFDLARKIRANQRGGKKSSGSAESTEEMLRADRGR
jgi:plasmid stability protein